MSVKANVNVIETNKTISKVEKEKKRQRKKDETRTANKIKVTFCHFRHVSRD